MTTIQDGRIDIVVFPNGGHEIIGRIQANPPIPEDDLIPQVDKFVSQLPPRKIPQEFTCIYNMKDNSLKMSWSDYIGPIPDVERDPVMVYSQIYTPEYFAEKMEGFSQEGNIGPVIDV